MLSLSTLSQQVIDVLAYSQGYNKNVFSHIPTLINQWWENKQRFFSYLGDTLIWEGPFVSIDYTPEIKEIMFNQFCDNAHNFLDFHREGNDDDWLAWITCNKKSFFDNIVTTPLPCSEMKQGMKLIKAFKFFDFNESDLRYLQDLASQYIQKTKIEGTLCISIHPLDYLTLSENNAHWRSCHALDGEYRAGNLSYMLDETSVICYIKSKENVQLKQFPHGMLWNNKKWRVLLHIHRNNNIAYVNRQYPFSCSQLIDKLMDTPFMRAIKLDYCHGTYFQEEGFSEVGNRKLAQNYFMMNGFILDPKETCAGDEYSLQYNDFISSPQYTPEFIIPNSEYLTFYSSSRTLVRKFSVPIGKRVLCPCCGTNFLEDSCSFLCEECQNKIDGIIGNCEECGACIYTYDYYGTTPDGSIYCEKCANMMKEQGEEIEMD